MDIFSIVAGILSWLQVGMGQASVTAVTLYQGAVVVDKVTTEDLRGTWSAELQDQGIQTIKGFVVRIDVQE
jgi:hypothetical protein